MFGVAFLALVLGFVGFALSLEDKESAIVPHADGIVALTGGADRIADAVDLVAGGHADRLLISGVNEATSVEEITRVTPRARALINCCIDLGYDARNTIGNAAETRRWAHMRGIRNSLIVVTSNYHMPRALLEIGRVLPQVTLVPHPVVSEHLRGKIWSDPQVTRLVAMEYLKYVAALVRARFADPVADDRLFPTTRHMARR